MYTPTHQWWIFSNGSEFFMDDAAAARHGQEPKVTWSSPLGRRSEANHSPLGGWGPHGQALAHPQYGLPKSCSTPPRNHGIVGNKSAEILLKGPFFEAVWYRGDGSYHKSRLMVQRRGVPTKRVHFTKRMKPLRRWVRIDHGQHEPFTPEPYDSYTVPSGKLT